MVKVTYGIRFSKQSPLAQEIRLQKSKLKRYVVRNETRQACKTALLVADLYLSQADYIDTDLPESDQQQDRKDHASEALKFCTKSNPVFVKYDDYKQLARSYLLMLQCYQRLERFDDAFTLGNKLVDLFEQPNPKVKDSTLLQQSYKLVADTYFTHGLLGNHISKNSDLPFALEFYEKERTVLETMTPDVLKGDDVAAYADDKRSSDFNLGVVKSKLMNPSFSGRDGKAAEDHLKKAIKGSIDLDDVDSERKTWWELGNLFSKLGEFEKVVGCLEKELSLARKHNLGDELGSMIDLVKALVQLEDYSACMEICREMRQYVARTNTGDELETQNDLVQEIVDMVLTVQARRLELTELYKTAKEVHFDHNKSNNIDIHTSFYDYDNPRIRNAVIGRTMRRQIGTVCLSLGQLLSDSNLLTASQKIVDDGLSYVVDADTDDSNLKEDVSLPLMRLRIKLLQIKADNHWNLHDCSMDQLVKMNKTVIDLATMYLQDQQELLEALLPSQTRNRDICHYYDHLQEATQWRRAARVTEKKYNLLIGKQGDEYEDDEIMHDDSTTDDEAMGDEYATNAPTAIALHPKALFDASNNRTKLSVTVALKLRNKNEKMLIVCDDDTDTLEWLDTQVARRAWQLYGIEPTISHFRLNDEDLFPDDTLFMLTNAAEITLEAVVHGYKEKSILELYENSCSRLDKTPLAQIQRILKEKATDTTHLSLSGTGLSSEGLDAIIEVIQKLPSPLASMDLSANLLRDGDVISLFSAIACPPQLNLNSNLLTIDSLRFLVEKHSDSMESVELAYNFLGSTAQSRLEDLRQSCPKLYHFNIEGADICYPTSQPAYQAQSTQSAQPAHQAQPTQQQTAPVAPLSVL